MTNTHRIREIALELNQLGIDRKMEEQRQREREKELLQELVRITTEGNS